MALTFPRWIAAAIAGLLVIAAFFLSQKPKPPRELSAQEVLIRAEQRASSAVIQQATRLRGMTLRDSVREALARMPVVDTSRTFISTRLPDETQRYNRVLGTRLDLVRASPRQAPIDIAFILDTSPSVRQALVDVPLLGATHVLPAAPNERCLVIVRNHPHLSWYSAYNRVYWTTYLTGASTAARVLGPCGFYEAFGAPGRGVDEWLAKGAWKFGTSGAMRNPTTNTTYSEYWRYLPLWGLNAGWPLRMYVSAAGYRCLSGDADSCKGIVLNPNSDPDVPTVLRMAQDRIVPRADREGREWFSTLGPGEPQLLADMTRQLGSERFKEFWTSDKPAAEAFQAATGQDIGAWTVDWARGRYGANRRGPGADPWTTTLTILLTFAGLAAAITTSQRRQVA